MIIAVDFDGTMVKHKYPHIGEDIGAFKWLKLWQKWGAIIILNTMRSGDDLDKAINHIERNGVGLFGVNENPDQKKWTESPKVYAHLYIDDAAFGCPLIAPTGERPYVDWRLVGPMVYSYMVDNQYDSHYEYLHNIIFTNGYIAAKESVVHIPSRYEKMGGEDSE